MRAAQGDAEAAWQMMTVERRFWPGYMTLFRSYHDGLFGGSATYRAHMAEIEAQR